MKDGCPSCGDKDQQRTVGQVERSHPVKGMVTPTLYRCDACGYLYLLPPIEDDDERCAWHQNQG